MVSFAAALSPLLAAAAATKCVSLNRYQGPFFARFFSILWGMCPNGCAVKKVTSGNNVKRECLNWTSINISVELLALPKTACYKIREYWVSFTSQVFSLAFP